MWAHLVVAVVLQIKMRRIIVYNSKFNVDFSYLFLAPINFLRRSNTNMRSQKMSTSHMVGARDRGFGGPLSKWAFRVWVCVCVCVCGGGGGVGGGVRVWRRGG